MKDKAVLLRTRCLSADQIPMFLLIKLNMSGAIDKDIFKSGQHLFAPFKIARRGSSSGNEGDPSQRRAVRSRLTNAETEA
jgi:hypothetical protein